MKFTRPDGAVLEVTADTVRTQTSEQLAAALQQFIASAEPAPPEAAGTVENVE